MGSVCCVAAKDVTPPNELRNGNVRYSPSWSYRWDNRRRVAGEVDTSFSSFSDGVRRSSCLEIKSETLENSIYGSDVGTPLNSLQTPISQKCPVPEATSGKLSISVSDQPVSRNVSSEVKESTKFPITSDLAHVKFSPSTPSTSSVRTSLLSFKSQLFQKACDDRIRELKSSSNSVSEEKLSNAFPAWTDESNWASHGESSDNWSVNAFSEPMLTSRRGKWSFDSESLGDSKITRCSSRVSDVPSLDLRMCGVCSKLLIEKSLWSSSVVSILICGHVYHAECLENMTPESEKYDPPCPVCTLGEKQIVKLFEETLKAETECKWKAKKRLKNRVVDRHFDEDFKFDRKKSTRDEGKGDMGPSSTKRSSFEKPVFLKHFSFSSRGTRCISENSSSRKRGFFWAKSSRDYASSNLRIKR